VNALLLSNISAGIINAGPLEVSQTMFLVKSKSMEINRREGNEYGSRQLNVFVSWMDGMWWTRDDLVACGRTRLLE